MKKIILALIVFISISAFSDTGKVSVAQVTGLSAILSNKLSLTTADSRYNLVTNNVSPWAYVYRKGQVDTIASYKANLSGASFTGDVITSGGLLANTSTGYIHSYSIFRAGSAHLKLQINTNTVVSDYSIATMNTDALSGIKVQVGNSTNKTAAIVSGDGGNPFTRYIISALQTQFTTGFVDGNLMAPLGLWDWTNGTTHLFTMYSDKISVGVPFSAVNVSPSAQLIATSGGTTVLTAASPQINQLTGSLTHSIVLPDATTLPIGTTYIFHNSSTSPVSIKDNSTATLVTLAGGGQLEDKLYLNNNSTAAGGWMSYYNGIYIPSGVGVNINNSLTFLGTDGTTMSFPSTSKLIAAADGSNITALQSSTTATTQAVSINNTTIATTAFMRLYTQPINASATSLTAGSTVTWTPTLGTNRYTLIPAQAEVINMGTIPSSLVGTELTLLITTSGTTTYAVTAGANLRMQGALNTGTVNSMTFVLKFIVLSTASVTEISRTIAM